MVSNRRKWRAEYNRWVEEAERYNDSELLPLPETSSGRWLPRSLTLLFGMPADPLSRPQRAQRTHPSEEQLYMELLAQELDPNEECPDDGELEGSGDEYEDY
ncbi:hypothetical protein DFJ43DRAFT_1058373 [Lentinula guzmanii]|uniref:Uncharacterized protein n=1 Tax=Lentinula guzmanii TaxID=2804957 RepID=A0AA38JSJ6_9AGAR|nr:hypothetical protein DFJ43DRAFT_1058373 [Lentinula guzmanii]